MNERVDTKRRMPATAAATPLALLWSLPAWIVNAITVTLGLILVQCSISIAFGAQAAQTATSAAVCVSLADVAITPERVRRRVFVAIIGSMLAATLYLAVRSHAAAVIPTVALIMFGAMLLLSWGPKAGTVSFATALALVFAMSAPPSQPLTWERVVFALAGSGGYWIWAAATARLLQPVWRAMALGTAADSLAELLRLLTQRVLHPRDAAWESRIVSQEALLSDQLQSARDLVFGNERGSRAPLETTILLRLIDLRDLAMASNPEIEAIHSSSSAVDHSATIVRAMEVAQDAVRCTARCLRTRGSVRFNPDVDRSIRALLVELERSLPGDGEAALHRLRDLVHGELGHLVSIHELFTPGRQVDLPCRRQDLRRYIALDEWRLAAVTSNLRWEAPVFRHALRTAVTASAAYAVCSVVPWTPHPQWVLLTIAAVMQGSLAQTLERRNARVLGTLAGCVAVLLLSAIPSPLFLEASFLVAAGVAHAYLGVRYSVTAAAAAVMAVLQAHLVTSGAGFSIPERFGDTVAGALLGWAATYALPTWERRQLPGTLQQAMDAIRAYAAEATKVGDDASGLPRFARQRAYDAVRAIGVAGTRSIVEPANVRVPLSPLTCWMSAAYGVMSHLSSLRLTLTLHSDERDRAGFVDAMAAVSHQFDTLLRAGVAAAPVTPHVDPASEAALAAVAHLLPRVRCALDDAGRLVAQSERIRAQLQATA